MQEGQERFRTLSGPVRGLQTALLCLIPLIGILFLLEVPFYLGLTLFREQFVGLFLGLVLAATYISIPARRGAAPTHVPWYDWLFAAAGLCVGLYVAVFYPQVAFRLASLTPDKVWLGAIGVILVLEAVRRVTGWFLPALIVVFILYARYGDVFSGILRTRGASWERIAVYLYLDSHGMLGLPLVVSATVVLAYIFFGQVLFDSGGGTFLTNLATSAMGRFRGGPAKMAVVASSLFGTISGSAVSNVVMTGSVTIPMMIRTGYRPQFAAAVEAVASTGGQLMPPVMGVTAFIIAEFLSIPYVSVVYAALLPAILYYAVLFIQVDLEAARQGLKGVPRAEVPALGEVLRSGWYFFIPLGLLVYTLFVLHWPAGRSAIVGAFAALIIFFYKEARGQGKLRRLVQLLEGTGKGLIELGTITAAAGFVIGVLQLTGVGFRLSMSLTSLAGGSVGLLLILTAAASIVLGMGMPTPAVYILLAVLVAPAIVELGIDPLSAHLFVFYFGLLSMITPPICLATFTAATIARTHFMSTVWLGIRLGLVAYVVPFLFVFSPELTLRGSPGAVIAAVVTALIGSGMLAVALSGYFVSSVSMQRRALLVVASLALLLPPVGDGPLFSWWVNLAGAALGAVVLVPDWLANGARARGAQSVPAK